MCLFSHVSMFIFFIKNWHRIHLTQSSQYIRKDPFQTSTRKYQFSCSAFFSLPDQDKFSHLRLSLHSGQSSPQIRYCAIINNTPSDYHNSSWRCFIFSSIFSRTSFILSSSQTTPCIPGFSAFGAGFFLGLSLPSPNTS